MRKFAGVFAGVLIAAAAVLSGAVSAAATDVVLTGQGPGGPPNVKSWGPTGAASDVNYNSNGTSTSGVAVAAGDITGDGSPEIITGTGPGLVAQVQVWAKDGKTLVAQANPFPGFTGGITVAAANVDETNQLEVIVGAGPGGGPHVKALRLVGGQLVESFSFYAYDINFKGGVYVAGTGGRIITGPGRGGGPHVKVIRINLGELSVEKEWFAYGTFDGGVRVAAGGVRSASAVDVVTGAGPGGGPHVKLWSLDGVEGPGLFAYDAGFRGGVWVGVGQGHLITGAGAGGGPHVFVRTFGANSTFPVKASFMAYAATFTGGVHVGGIPATTTPPTTTTGCTGIPPLCLPGGETTTTAAPTTTTTGAGGSTTTTSTTTSSTTTTVPATTTTTAPGGTTTSTTPGSTTTTTEPECVPGPPPLCA